MAQFYGEAVGSRGECHRLGTKASGLSTAAASWAGAVHCHVFHRHDLDEDWVQVELGQWKGAGQQPAVVLYRGPIGAYKPEDLSDVNKYALEAIGV